MGDDTETEIEYELQEWRSDDKQWRTILTWSAGTDEHNREQAIYWCKDYKHRLPTLNFRVLEVTIITTSTVITNL